MGLSRSILNLGRWLGAKPNALVGGRVDARIGAVASGLIGIKSIQTVQVEIDNTVSNGSTVDATIASVAIGKTLVFYLFTNDNNNSFLARLTGSTTLQVKKNYGASFPYHPAWTLVEFY